MDFVCNKQKIIVVNVYAPSDPIERKIFFPILKDFIKDLESTAFICIAGDFNCTVCPSLDRNSHEPHAASTKILGSIIKQYELKDVWRVQHPQSKCYTWCRYHDGAVSRARLDRIYVNEVMSNVVLKSQIVPAGFTDHDLVMMSFNIPDPACGSAYWSFNTSLLNDKKNFKESFRDVWGKIRSSKFEHANLRVWWDLAKSQIKTFCQQYSSFSSRTHSLSIDLLRTQIVALEQKTDGGKGSYDKELWEKRALLTEMVKQQAMGTLVRMRMGYLTLDMPNKDFFKLENNIKKSQQIHGLRALNGSLMTSQKGIRSVLKDFHSNLYSPPECGQ